MRLLPLVLLFCSAAVCSATDPHPIPRLIVKTNATTLINVYKPAVALTADLRVAPRFSVDASAGAILGSPIFAPRQGDTYSGLRLRSGFKYFADISENDAFHIGLEAKYNDVTNTRQRTVLRQGGQYRQIMPTDRLVRTIGFAGRLGWHFYSGANRRLLLELYTGIGGAWHTVKRAGLPPDAQPVEFEDRVFFNFEYPNGKSSTLDLLLGLHIGYAIW